MNKLELNNKRLPEFMADAKRNSIFSVLFCLAVFLLFSWANKNAVSYTYNSGNKNPKETKIIYKQDRKSKLSQSLKLKDQFEKKLMYKQEIEKLERALNRTDKGALQEIENYLEAIENAELKSVLFEILCANVPLSRLCINHIPEEYLLLYPSTSIHEYRLYNIQWYGFESLYLYAINFRTMTTDKADYMKLYSCFEICAGMILDKNELPTFGKIMIKFIENNNGYLLKNNNFLTDRVKMHLCITIAEYMPVFYKKHLEPLVKKEMNTQWGIYKNVGPFTKLNPENMDFTVAWEKELKKRTYWKYNWFGPDNPYL